MLPVARRLLLGLAVALAAALGGPDAAAQPVAVVAHPDVPVDDLDFGELRSLFLGDRKEWPNRLPVHLLVRTPGAYERKVMLERVVRMSEPRFRQYWSGRVSRGEVGRGQLKSSPSTATSWRLVRALPGAITLMAAPDVPPGARVVRLDGRKPWERGYPLP